LCVLGLADAIEHPSIRSLHLSLRFAQLCWLPVLQPRRKPQLPLRFREPPRLLEYHCSVKTGEWNYSYFRPSKERILSGRDEIRKLFRTPTPKSLFIHLLLKEILQFCSFSNCAGIADLRLR